MSDAENPCHKSVRVFHGASSGEMIFILGQRLESTVARAHQKSDTHVTFLLVVLKSKARTVGRKVTSCEGW